jgi:type II secretory pathway pseudopilin PulG
MLLESIVAISVITIVMGAIGAEFVSAIASTSRQRAEQTAIQLSDSESERVRSLHPSDLVLGRDQTSVQRQFANAPSTVRPYLSSMNQTWDTHAPNNSGATATLPTAASAAAPVTIQKPANITYNVLDYLGTCYIPSSGSACQADSTNSTDIPYLRDVIAVTWSDSRCASSVCAHVSALLISATPDQTFQVNQQLPPAPTLLSDPSFSNPLTVAVGDAITPIQLAVDDGKGVAPFSWTVKSGALPANLSLSPTGLISGTVGGNNTTNLSLTTVVEVTDAFLRKTTATIAWTVEPRLTVTYSTDPASVVNVALSPAVQLTASGGDGAPYTWSDPTHTLPPGLTLATNGAVSGTPNRVGTYPVSVRVVDKGGRRAAVGTFTWTVNYPPVVAGAVTNKTNTVNTAISTVTLSAAGGDGNFVWTDPSHTLPAGLTLASNGKITGTPTAPTTASVTLTVSDPSAGSGSAYTKTVTFTWSIVAKPTVVAPANQVSSRTSPINLALTTTCPNSPCTYSLSNTGLGLTVSNTGVISGTISAAQGTYSGITITVIDAQGVSVTSAPFSWTVNPAPTLGTITDRTTARSTAVNTDLSNAGSGGTGTLTFSATGLPAGLTMSSAGRVTGTTANSNSDNSVTVRLTDSTGATTTTSFQWHVSNLALTVADQSSHVSKSVSLDLSTLPTGGTSPYTFAVTSLPSWLSYSATTRTISGTSPASTTTASGITVKVTDTKGATFTGTFNWNVIGPLGVSMGTVSTPRNSAMNPVSATPSNPIGTLTWSASNLPTGVSINPSTGVFSGTPTSVKGSRSVTVTVTDGTGASASTAFTWTIT